MNDPQRMQAPTGALWTFACRLYARPDVAQACLTAQEEAGVSVNWLLACAWLATCGQRLDYNVIQGATAWQQWHEDITLPLRKVRRLLKAQAPNHLLYGRLKQAELDAEHEELNRLEVQLNPLGAESGEVAPQVLFSDNLALYLRWLGLEGQPLAQRQAQLAIIGHSL